MASDEKEKAKHVNVRKWNVPGRENRKGPKVWKEFDSFSV